MLSIVLPSYNEQQMIEKTNAVLSELLENEGIDYELIFVNDGSKDDTWKMIEKVQSDNPHVVGINFSRNFGKESAMYAGLSLAKGDCIAMMDCDLQHPPATLIEMYRKWEEGYEVVEGIKRSRGKESVFHGFMSKLFYSIISRAVKIDMKHASDFKILDRKAADAVLSMPERNAFFRALSSWVGFKTCSVEFDVQEREVGESKWTTRSLFKYAMTNIVAFSSMPMQIVTVLGVITFILGVILSIQTIVKFFMGTAVEGFTTVILLILFIGSMIMISLGVIGYYISKVYEEVKARPRYLISKIIGRGSEENEDDLH